MKIAEAIIAFIQTKFNFPSSRDMIFPLHLGNLQRWHFRFQKGKLSDPSRYTSRGGMIELFLFNFNLVIRCRC